MVEQFLITGATGVVGGRVLKSLTGGGFAAKGASRKMTGPGWVKLDLLDPATFAPALAGVSTVMLASRPGDEDADVYAAPLIDAMRKQGVRRVVVLSALGAQLRPEFSLRKVEILAENSGLAWTFVRPNFFMQMLSAPPFSAEMARGTLSLPLGRAHIAYVDAGDVAAVLVRALTDPGLSGRGIDVSGPQALDHYEIAAAVSAAAGRSVSYVDLTEDEARRLLGRCGFAAPQVERLIRFYALVRQGYCAVPDAGAAKLLGRPLVRFEDFAKANAAAWRPLGL